MPNRSELLLEEDATDVYGALQAEYQATLVAPLDDMWATFADGGAHHALRLGGEAAGFCSVNESSELLAFHLGTRFEDRAEALFGEIIERLGLLAALPPTVAPGFLSLSLGAGRVSETKALMYQHLLEPEGDALTNLRPAGAADQGEATAFVEAATGLPRSFLESYVAERIDRTELFLHAEGGEILASGECRTDRRQPGHAHLGMIVGRGHRGRGLGSRLMHALVLESRRRALRPLCSTEPDNLPARRAILKAGFRARHRVFRVAFDGAGSERRKD